MRAVNTSFITPFDREDIALLAARLDEVIDEMEEAGDLTVLYRLGELPDGVRQQVALLMEAAELTAEAPRGRARRAGRAEGDGHHRAGSGHHRPPEPVAVPVWVVLLCATALAAGTYSGGWRIIRTLGRRIFPPTPPHGFVAEATASVVLYLSAFVIAAPISTTHVMTASVMGVGSTRRLSAVRWGVAREIVVAWVLTLPAAAAVGALVYPLARLVANG